MNLLNNALSFFVILLFSGCAAPISITYNSDPPGAMLYENEKFVGYCPVTLTYYIKNQNISKDGYYIIKGTSAKWISGAHAEIDFLRARMTNGFNQQFTFKRPDGFEKLEDDVRFGLEVYKTKLVENQIKAQQETNDIILYNAIMNQKNNSTPINIPTNCKSRVVGSTIYTDCF